jgi:hypothetical protein
MQSTRSGRFVLVRAGKRATNPTQTIVPQWVTADGYTTDLTVRSKVGDEQGASRIGRLDTTTGEIVWIDVAPGDDRETEEDAAPQEDATSEDHDQSDSAAALGDDAPVEDGAASRAKKRKQAPRIFASGWNEAGTKAFVVAVSFDNKDRWLWSIDAASGEHTLLDSLHNDASVAGPCSFGCIGFLSGTDLSTSSAKNRATRTCMPSTRMVRTARGSRAAIGKC